MTWIVVYSDIVMSTELVVYSDIVVNTGLVVYSDIVVYMFVEWCIAYILYRVV